MSDKNRSALPRQNRVWQFSLFSLLALMTGVSIYLAIAKTYPALAIIIFFTGLGTAALLIADSVARRANSSVWKLMTAVAWCLVGILFLFVIAVVAFMALIL